MAWNQGSVGAGCEVRSAKPGRAGAPRTPRSGMIRGIIAGLVIVLGAIGAFLFFTKGSEEAKATPIVEKKSAKIVEGEVVEQHLESSEAKKLEKPEVAKSDEALTPLQKHLKGMVLISAKTNEDSGVIYERYQCKDGTTHSNTIVPPPLFSRPSDQIISMLVCRNPNTPIPPLPPMGPGSLDRSFSESLLEPIVISPDDSPRVAAEKAAVAEMRSEIAEAIKAGDDRGVAEILADYVADVNKNIRIKGDALNMINEVIKSDGEEAGREYLGKVNKYFESIGIDPIKRNSKEQ